MQIINPLLGKCESMKELSEGETTHKSIFAGKESGNLIRVLSPDSGPPDPLHS